jgi:cation diffusion facilitator CzcD-associated flavoprotein CzcO
MRGKRVAVIGNGCSGWALLSSDGKVAVLIE